MDKVRPPTAKLVRDSSVNVSFPKTITLAAISAAAARILKGVGVCATKSGGCRRWTGAIPLELAIDLRRSACLAYVITFEILGSIADT
jgi:hypothetical protein